MSSTATIGKPERRVRGSQAFLFTSRPDGPEVDEDVFGLDRAQVMDFVVEQRRRQNIAAAQELRGLTAWADLHRVTDGVLGSVDDAVTDFLPRAEAILGREGERRLAGQGTFLVTEFAITEIAAALGMSEPAARAKVGQALELRERLPRLWERVMDGDLPEWKARRVAEETIALNGRAAAYVDTHLAPYAHRLGVRQIVRCVNTAINLYDLQAARERAERAGDGRGVWTADRLDGVGELHAVLDTPDLHALETSVRHGAAGLAVLGDTDAEQVRRAKALGILADPQYALDLTAAAEARTAPDRDASRPQRPRREHTGDGAPSVVPTIHIHVHTDSLADDAVPGHAGVRAPDSGTGRRGAGPGTGVARVEGAGIERNGYPLAAVERWITNLAPASLIKVTPVVDLTAHLSVDAYEIPERLRQQVEHRDTAGCVFPWCGRSGRFDVDHIDGYDFADPGSGRPPPAGQTNTANSARLCRFHHRVKTHGRWHYRRRGPTAVEWTSPLGRRYTVDHTGTTACS